MTTVRSDEAVGVGGPAERVAEAPAGAVPDLLARPPWTRRRGYRPPVVAGLACADVPGVEWCDGERESWSRADPDETLDREACRWRAGRHRAGELSPEHTLSFFLAAPDDLARPLVGAWRPGADFVRANRAAFRAVVARFEVDALPMVVDLAEGDKAYADLLLPFTGPRVAVLMARWWDRFSSLRAVVLTWLRRHPVAAARALVPAALDRPGPARRQAGHALRVLVEAGHADVVRRAAHGYGPEAAAGIDDLLATGALFLLPTRIPAGPDWVDPADLPAPVLADGAGALPVTAVGHLLTMLAMSRPGEPYAGVADVRRACGPASLARFGWALFERWVETHMPTATEQVWALHTLGWLGDDDTAGRLAQVVAEWPNNPRGRARIVAALEVLGAIGTDTALLHLHRVVEKIRPPALRRRADDMVGHLAMRRGLTAVQLADRAVPRFGLDDDGTVALDYGPRRFVVGFDGQLKPYVLGADGGRRRALPRPAAKDDPELAAAAQRRFTALRKEVKTVAEEQVRRLERAMVRQDRWRAGDLTQQVMTHPLLWPVVSRLVWTVHDSSGAVVGAVRLAEDRSFADVDDKPVTLAGDALLSVAHPVHLGVDLALWAEVFDDYGILQPFAQLGRGAYHLTGAERGVVRLARQEGRSVSADGILALKRRGWRFDEWDGGDHHLVIRRDVDADRSVVVGLDPGVPIDRSIPAVDQTVTVVRVRHNGVPDRQIPFGDLDPVLVSEIIRDLEETPR